MDEGFKLGEKVKMKYHDIVGVVVAIHEDFKGIQYQVEWMAEKTTINSRYFAFAELKRAE